MPHWLKVLLFALAVGLVAFALLMRPRAPALEEPANLPKPFPSTAHTVIHLGTIDAQIDLENQRLTRFLKPLNRHLAAHDIVVRPIVAPDLPAMQALMREGKVDAVFDTPIAVALLDQSGPLRIALNRHKEGDSSYHGVVFSLLKSPFEKLADLAGRRFAAESEYSTSAFFLPLEAFAIHGIGTVIQPDPTGPLVPEVVNVVISEKESVSLLWVLTERVEAGAMKNTAYDALDAELRSQLRVIYRTATMPREILAVRSTLPTDRAELFVGALARMHTTAAGRAALEEFEKTTLFEPIAEPVDLMARLQAVSQRRSILRRP